MFIHGHAARSATRQQRLTYACWQSMLRRCYTQGSQGFARYGKRGIRVCRRWHSFKNFIADMGLKPDTLTLERKNNDGNYEKRNCVWATKREQNRNHSRNRMICFQGRTQLIADWARERGFSHSTLTHRLNNYSVRLAMTAPVCRGRKYLKEPT